MNTSPRAPVRFIINADVEVNEEVLKELIYLTVNARFYQRRWKKHYGAINRNMMNYWDARLDAWIKEHCKLSIDPEDEK